MSEAISWFVGLVAVVVGGALLCLILANALGLTSIPAELTLDDEELAERQGHISLT